MLVNRRVQNVEEKIHMCNLNVYVLFSDGDGDGGLYFGKVFCLRRVAADSLRVFQLLFFSTVKIV
jgi:hypothetical protein